MRQILLLGLAGAALASVACSGSEDDIARTGDGDGSAEAGDGGSGGSSRGSGGRTTGSGGRTRGSGGRVGTGGRPSSGGAAGAVGSGGAGASGGVAGSGGTVASGGAGGATDAGAPDARDASTDAGSMDATSDQSSADASSGDAGESGSDAGVIPFAIDLLFDNSSGQITYSGLNASNWSADPQYTLPHSGAEAIMSANGNATGTFANIGFSKVLGGSIENRQYRVSFWVVQYYPGLSGIELADFSALKIGGPSGTMTWTDTPVPSVADVWVKWTGTYTPAPSDVGKPFHFEAVFNLDGMHSIGIDGPIVAEPL
jgi:hypothetical protein